MYRITAYALVALLLGAGGAFAESGLGDEDGATTAVVTGAGTDGSSSSSTSSGGGEATETGFDALSPGNRKIAEALYQGQSDGDGETLTGWTRDDIALAKQDGQGWGQIFKQMKDDGLVDASNLGQLVSKYHRELNGSLPAEDGAAGGIGDDPTLDGAGDSDGASTPNGDGTGTATGPSSAEGSAARPGAYKELSPGGQKIADALFEAQKPVEGSGDVWSSDRIATAKQDGQGWGEIFKQMKQDQLFSERNLGQLVSGQGKIDVATATGGGAGLIVTDGGGNQRVVGGGKSVGKAAAGQEGSRAGKPTVGTAGGSRGGGIGNRGGTTTAGWHGRGVVTAGGASVGGQSASASLSGGGNSGSARGRIK